MTDEICLVSDTHGAGNTFLRLLNQVAAARPGARLISLGDEIDRGPRSRAMVEFMMANQIPSVASNHIDLCLAYSAHTRRGYKARCARYYDPDVWLWNGGENALANWLPDQTRWHEGLPKEVLDWMQALPPYLIPDAPLDDSGLRLLCSHTGYALEADQGDDMGWHGALWGRHPDEGPFPEDGYYRVHGHTRVRKVEVTDRWCNIDSGAAYEGYGLMTALIWPSKALVIQPFDESSCEPRFTMRDGRLTP